MEIYIQGDIMLTFWTGFAFGVAAMFLITFAVTIWFVIQAANFHDSWLNTKDEKK